MYLRGPRLAVVITSEGSQGEREGEEEDNEGRDDEAEDAIVLPSAGEEAAVVAGREGLRSVLHEYVVEPPGAQRVILCYANSNFVMQRSSPTPTLQDWEDFHFQEISLSIIHPLSVILSEYLESDIFY